MVGEICQEYGGDLHLIRMDLLSFSAICLVRLDCED